MVGGRDLTRGSAELLKADFHRFLLLDATAQLSNNLRQVVKTRVTNQFRKYRVPFWASIPEDRLPVLAELGNLVQFGADEVCAL